MRILFLFIFLFFGCGNSSQINDSHILDANRTKAYGTVSNVELEIKTYLSTAIYMPKNRVVGKKLPIVLFAPGWGSNDHNDYKTLLSFIASCGYIAIYTSSTMEYSAEQTINRFEMILNNDTISKSFDKSRLGVMGHSSGGGIAFKILDHFSKSGYGKRARFLFSMDPWFAFGMSENDFKNFPKSTKVVIQQYGNSGSTDPRIALTIYDKITTVGDDNRDYQVYEDLNHGYPISSDLNYTKKEVILKPLDALMDYVFNSNEFAHKFALELGSDTPYKDKLQSVLPSKTYGYKCYPESNELKSVLQEYGLDYCKIVP